MSRDPIFYSGLATVAADGRRDAVDHPDYGRGPVVVYSRNDRHAAAVAFWRARGMAGHRNRHQRRRSVAV